MFLMQEWSILKRMKKHNQHMHSERVPAVSILVLIDFGNANWFSASLHPTGTRQ